MPRQLKVIANNVTENAPFRVNWTTPVIIKPGKKSNYRNLVDILDEMAIVGVPTNAIVNDITPEELKLIGDK